MTRMAIKIIQATVVVTSRQLEFTMAVAVSMTVRHDTLQAFRIRSPGSRPIPEAIKITTHPRLVESGKRVWCVLWRGSLGHVPGNYTDISRAHERLANHVDAMGDVLGI